jgi:hypothetical protein
MIGKEYTQHEISSKFRKKICLECENGKLEYNGHKDWIEFYKCDSCKTKYEFQETDMGQTLPRLESNA